MFIYKFNEGYVIELIRFTLMKYLLMNFDVPMIGNCYSYCLLGCDTVQSGKRPTLKVEAVGFPKRSVHLYQSAQFYIPEDRNPQILNV